jgi:large subunit ribosomal protein L15
MPIQRRVPKRGFNNARHAVTYEVVNLQSLEERFEAGAEITAVELLSAGLIHGNRNGVKILATGELTKAFTVKASAFSAKAAEKIAAAGGKAEVI